ncbi:MAG TPA: ribonuclease H [Gemmatimonadales bacterium]|nr:ribonuclease H [Gemmatimonadales bacterium]
MSRIALVHLDESCLGNGRDGENPGGYGGLIEARTRSGIQRRDFFGHARAATNNRMALSGAIAALQLLSSKGARMRVLIVSDSEYLVKGLRLWVPNWVARGWKRAGGPIENLQLWRDLVDAARQHDVQWTWVRGHAGHPKNEYVNDVAVAAAREQTTSAGAVESKFADWLAAKQAKGKFPGYDPDANFETLARRLAAVEEFPLAE